MSASARESMKEDFVHHPTNAHYSPTHPPHHHSNYGHNANATTSAPTHRKFGNPGPLGLSAFALTTFVLSLINIQTRGIEHPNIVCGLAYGYGGLVQLLAGMWEFAVGNTFGATALSSYGGFWISYAIIISAGPASFGIEEAYSSESELQSAIGFYLAGWFIFTFILMICTFKSNVAFFLLFLFLDITFLLLAIGHFIQTSGGKPTASIIKAGGVFGLITAFIAWYNALAQMAETSNSFFKYPTGEFPWSEKKRAAKAERHPHAV